MDSESLQSLLQEWRDKLQNARAGILASGAATSNAQLQVYHTARTLYVEIANRTRKNLVGKLALDATNESLKNLVEAATVVENDANQEPTATQMAERYKIGGFIPMDIKPDGILASYYRAGSALETNATTPSPSNSAGGNGASSDSTSPGETGVSQEMKVKMETSSGKVPNVIDELMREQKERTRDHALQEIKVLSEFVKKTQYTTHL